MTKLVMTVDDSRTMRDMLRHTLSEAGYRVVQAVDGVHGLEVLAGESPDVIVTDINMPRMDGFGFIEGVRRSDRHRATPILVLTTESDAEKKNRARRSGATGWIVKPFNPVKLVEAVRRVAA
ncbi:response regulator [Muricoccus radiodurans]|uniref:response regulator n=1 Tax=Muricoccus radiodurans TaxID=2231721 RepID=UPI003CF662F5